jgi:hypothetical protein
MLLIRLLINGLNKVVIELAHQRVQLTPVVGQGLEDDGVAVAPHADFPRLETKLLRKSHRL